MDKRYKKHEEHLELKPGVSKLLIKLKKEKIISVILSTSPHDKDVAQDNLARKLEYFEICNLILIDSYYATDDYPQSKGEFIEKILREKKLIKKDALMVGDSYGWDYKPAQDVGVDAILIDSEYEDQSKKTSNIIDQLGELDQFLEN